MIITHVKLTRLSRRYSRIWVYTWGQHSCRQVYTCRERARGPPARGYSHITSLRICVAKKIERSFLIWKTPEDHCWSQLFIKGLVFFYPPGAGRLLISVESSILPKQWKRERSCRVCCILPKRNVGGGSVIYPPPHPRKTAMISRY